MTLDIVIRYIIFPMVASAAAIALVVNTIRLFRELREEEGMRKEVTRAPQQSPEITARRSRATARFMLRAIAAAEKAGGPKAQEVFKAQLRTQAEGER